MTDLLSNESGRVVAVARWGFRLLLFGAMTFVWFTVLLPNASLAHLRSQWQPVSSAISWVESIYPPLDMVHVVLFFGLGFLSALSFSAARKATQLWSIVVLAAATELVQIRVPGRSAKFSDFAVDIVGGAAGLMTSWLVVFVLMKLEALCRGTPKPDSHAGRQQR